VIARLSINESGRVPACEILRSSGNQHLDSTTCRLIQQRFRFRPARDRNGQPVSDYAAWQQTWWLARRGERRREAEAVSKQEPATVEKTDEPSVVATRSSGQ
jgi:TonB family protein